MRWIVTVDHHGGCSGLGEDANGVPARGNPEQAAALSMDFRLHLASGEVLFEGRCGDIDADWWHGFEPLNYLWQPFRCRRLSYRRAGTQDAWHWLRAHKLIAWSHVAAAVPARDGGFRASIRRCGRKTRSPGGARLAGQCRHCRKHPRH